MEIKFHNRITGKIEREIVYGDKFIEWLYKAESGKALSTIICKAPLSQMYGALQDSKLSQRKVAPFVKNFHINMDDFLPHDGRSDHSPYANFNQFFIRRFKPGKRPFVHEPTDLAAFAEARYYGYETVHDEESVPVKGLHLKPHALLDNKKWENIFHDGPMLLARLCPVDYHRFHFPDEGTILDDYRIKGSFHSVNPLALKAKEDILITNERHVSILETTNFGKLAYIEVGAICVGKIVQSQPLTVGRKFHRGEEKGYFLFGGSTVIVIGEKGKWKPSQDIVDNTKNHLETYIHLGMTVAHKGK